jgi:hypothetical protein
MIFSLSSDIMMTKIIYYLDFRSFLRLRMVNSNNIITRHRNDKLWIFYYGLIGKTYNSTEDRKTIFRIHYESAIKYNTRYHSTPYRRFKIKDTLIYPGDLSYINRVILPDSGYQFQDLRDRILKSWKENIVPIDYSHSDQWLCCILTSLCCMCYCTYRQMEGTIYDNEYEKLQIANVEAERFQSEILAKCNRYIKINFIQKSATTRACVITYRIYNDKLSALCI